MELPINRKKPLPVFSFEPEDPARHENLRIYNFVGSLPGQSDLLIPHRKDYYLIAFVRRAAGRQWIDLTPYELKDNAVYFTSPGQIIVKEGFEKLWSTGIAFTRSFLTTEQNKSLGQLPLIQNPQNAHELLLSDADVIFVEDILAKLNYEYQHPGKWERTMLAAYLTLLLTYLSRLYSIQFNDSSAMGAKLLLKQYWELIDTHFMELREVGDYASLLHVSTGHLSELIKAQSGRPAIKHIHERLVLESRRLLFHTDGSLKEIAFDLGFADASYFSRFFKRETGMTPAVFRNNIREMHH